MLNHVDLCSGIGGFALGFEWAGLSRPILFCDIEPWSRQILKKHWPDVPICEDVKEIAADPDRFIPGRVDILTAGYPCQPFSVAGNQRGTEDPRHIYPYISRIVARKRPTWCVFENVYGHVSLGLDEVLNDLEGQGYSIRPFIVPASAVNAPHKRDRLWIIARVGNTKHDGSSASKIEGSNRKDAERTSEGSIKTKQSEGTSRSRNDEAMAYTDGKGLQGHDEFETKQTRTSPGQSKEGVMANTSVIGLQEHGHGTTTQSGEGGKTMADTDGKRQQGSWLHGRPKHQTQNKDWQADRANNSSQGNAQFWLSEPSVGRVADGISSRVGRFGEHEGWEKEPEGMTRVAVGVPDRVSKLRGLGNAIVPQIAQKIGETILKLEKD